MRFLNTGHVVFPWGPLSKWWMLLQNEHCGRQYGTHAKQRLCAFLSFVLTLGLIISGRSTGAQAFSCPSPFSLSFTCIWMHLGCFSETLTISSSSPYFSSLSLPLCTSSAKPKWSCHISNGLNSFCSILADYSYLKFFEFQFLLQPDVDKKLYSYMHYCIQVNKFLSYYITSDKNADGY